MRDAIKRHWPEYLMEAICLGLFMVSAFIFGTIFEHPASPIRQAVSDPLLRRLFMGLAMGLTAFSIIYSPWGKQSGAHGFTEDGRSPAALARADLDCNTTGGFLTDSFCPDRSINKSSSTIKNAKNSLGVI